MIAAATQIPVLSQERAAALAAKAVARCRELANITDVPGGTTRTFLSAGMRRANLLVGGWMQDAGCEVRMDAAGNLRGVLRSQNAHARTFVMASHLDTVPNAGAFDGVLGVVLALAIAEVLQDTALPFHLELIAFSEEEGVRFGVPFIGSRALVGELDEALLSRSDAIGISVQQAMEQYGLAVHELPSARLTDPLGYLEFHIEQGPALESEGLPLGVVETVAGQSRYTLRFTGRANHAGTTPMALRHDALAAAAAWISEVEQLATRTPGLVATVGSITAAPNASNVIAAEVTASLDVRSALDSTREDATRHLLQAAERAAAQRGVNMHATERLQQPAVPMDRRLLTLLEDGVDATGAPIRRMVSGAGHDAMVVAPHMPAAMLFLRSPGGISHHPDEDVRMEDVALALQAGVHFVQALALQQEAL